MSGKCAALAQGYCQLRASCDQLGAIGQSTEAGCEERARQSCEVALNLSNAVLSDAQLATCTGSIKLFACESLASGGVESCGLPGTLADGATCQASFQCKGAYCELSAGACGRCTTLTAPPNLGESCDPANDRCRDSFCSPKKVCTIWAKKGDACVSTYQCDSMLACSGQVCVPSIGVGQSCDTTGDLCDYGLHCEPLPFGSKEGTCQEQKTLMSGAACGAQHPGTVCPSGEVCRGGTCQKPLEDGAACDSDGACLPPARCSYGHCQLYGACAKG
jgi:hypothetical protein